MGVWPRFHVACGVRPYRLRTGLSLVCRCLDPAHTGIGCCPLQVSVCNRGGWVGSVLDDGQRLLDPVQLLLAVLREAVEYLQYGLGFDMVA